MEETSDSSRRKRKPGEKGNGSSASSKNTTKYATAKRHGRLLQMHVKKVEHSEANLDNRIDEFSDENGLGTVVRNGEVDTSNLPEILQQLEKDSNEDSAFPSQEIDRHTMRFKDEKLEQEYRIFATKDSINSDWIQSFLDHKILAFFRMEFDFLCLLPLDKI